MSMQYYNTLSVAACLEQSGVPVIPQGWHQCAKPNSRSIALEFCKFKLTDSIRHRVLTPDIFTCGDVADLAGMQNCK